VTQSSLKKLCFALLLVGLIDVPTAEAGQRVPAAAPRSPAAPIESGDLPLEFDGPPPPAAPDVISRDESGRATVRAVRAPSPPRIDGQLDDDVYEQVMPISGFLQVEPQAGQPATEKTEVWVTFDEKHIYLAARCWETDPNRRVANSMRRDVAFSQSGADFVEFVFDTFHDRRNGVDFAVNAIGGIVDGQITNERQFNRDWNPVWEVIVGRFDGGWTLEAAIPFKSLRYRPGPTQIWGFNVLRFTTWKNEISTLTRTPEALANRAAMAVSRAATLVGLEVPPGSKNLDVKPYAVSSLSSDYGTARRVANDLGGDLGLDVKYGVTQNLTADFTYNTDFAQVEADEQQVNLTRFNLFFPEKREFFLENQGTFAFGDAAANATAQQQGSDTPILFYSRRIGLNQGNVVPIQGGARLTGRLGRFSLGMLNMQADDESRSGTRATNFSVLRLKRDILRKSSVGVMYTGRSVGPSGGARNDAYGLDAALAFFDNLAFNAYWAQTRTPGLAGDDASYRLHMDYAGDRYGVQAERLSVGARFNPEAGFVRRGDVRRTFGLFRFSPRPRASTRVRKYAWIGSINYVHNGSGTLETRAADGEFNVEFQNTDKFTLAYSSNYEFLVRPFAIAPAVTVAVGGYEFGSARAAFNFGRHRRILGNVTAEHGTFYDGRKTTVSVAAGRVRITPRFSLEPNGSVNRVTLGAGEFTTTLIGQRITYTMTPRLFVSALLQYNSSGNSVATNARLRWEYRPGSELFVVYNEQRDTLAARFPTLANRAVIVKVNRLFRF
jgi:hypothetical protein